MKVPEIGMIKEIAENLEMDKACFRYNPQLPEFILRRDYWTD